MACDSPVSIAGSLELRAAQDLCTSASLLGNSSCARHSHPLRRTTRYVTTSAYTRPGRPSWMAAVGTPPAFRRPGDINSWGGSDAAAVWCVDRACVCGSGDSLWCVFGALDPGAIP